MHTFKEGVEFKLFCSDKILCKPSSSSRCTDFNAGLSVVIGGGRGDVAVIAYITFLQIIHIFYPASN